MAKDVKELIVDYIVFIILVVVTSVVPLWGRFFGKKKTRTKADYVFATGAVSVFSMMMSIARGTLGVRSFLGKSVSQCLFALLQCYATRQVFRAKSFIAERACGRLCTEWSTLIRSSASFSFPFTSTSGSRPCISTSNFDLTAASCAALHPGLTFSARFSISA